MYSASSASKPMTFGGTAQYAAVSDLWTSKPAPSTAITGAHATSASTSPTGLSSDCSNGKT